MRKRRVRRGAVRGGLGCALLFSLAAVVGGLALAFGYAALFRDLPSLAALPEMLSAPDGSLLQATRLYDRTGRQELLALSNPSAGEPAYLSLADGEGEGLDTALIQATLAVQDPLFWRHPGLSPYSLLPGGQAGLAEQMAAELLLGDESPGWRRRMRARLLGVQITSEYGRRQVLEWALNHRDYGQLAYGAEAGAQVYFGKPSAGLSLSEAALLAAAGLDPQNNPHTDLPAARRIQAEILQAMAGLGWLSGAEAAQAIAGEVAVALPAQPAENEALLLTSLALEQLGTQLEPARYRRGLKVITTLDASLQRDALCVLEAQLARLSGQSSEPECAAARLLPALPPPDQSSSGDAAEESAADPQAPGEPGAALQGGGELAGAVLALDPRSGQILALAGAGAGDGERVGAGASVRANAGSDAREDASATGSAEDGSAEDGESGGAVTPPSGDGDSGGGVAGTPELMPTRPAGTLLAPFVYLTAFTRGLGPASLLWDLPARLPTGEPGNFDGQFHGPLRLRTAAANNYLAPLAQLVGQVGAENVRRTAASFGVELAQTAAAAPLAGLLEQPLSLLDIVPAYAALANQGSQAGRVISPGAGLAPTALLRVEDLDGRVLIDWSQPEQRPLTTPALAYLVNHVLSDEPARWPSLGRSNPLEIGRPAAVQIGRSPTAADAWTVGWTPQVAIGTWIGPSETATPESAALSPSSPAGGTALSGDGDSGTTRLSLSSAGVWHSLARAASSSQPFQGWTAPPGVSSLQVCDPSGMLATAACPAVVEEIFLPGSEPTQPDDFYQVIPVNRETGLRATLFTAPELVEERVFPSLPPDALDWAQQTGLDLPPENFDVIPAAAPVEGRPAITSPAPFEAVRGVVAISGSTGSGPLSFYRVQSGQGLNPPAWLQIGEQAEQPVASGELAQWDTTGLDGLYSLQLQVVGAEGALQTATLQVSVDNQPPEPQALYPQDGQAVAARSGLVLLRAAAADNLQVARVDFAIDGRQLGSLSAAPYTLAWNARPGQHELTITAVDSAGNEASVTLNFTVK